MNAHVKNWKLNKNNLHMLHSYSSAHFQEMLPKNNYTKNKTVY